MTAYITKSYADAVYFALWKKNTAISLQKKTVNKMLAVRAVEPH
jgi:hypothetical protein